jgi:excisionase family DNA binding protein
MSIPYRSDVITPPATATSLTVDESAVALRVCRASIYNLMKRGELGWVQLPGMQRRRIPISEIERILGTAP